MLPASRYGGYMHRSSVHRKTAEARREITRPNNPLSSRSMASLAQDVEWTSFGALVERVQQEQAAYVSKPSGYIQCDCGVAEELSVRRCNILDEAHQARIRMENAVDAADQAKRRIADAAGADKKAAAESAELDAAIVDVDSRIAEVVALIKQGKDKESSLALRAREIADRSREADELSLDANLCNGQLRQVAEHNDLLRLQLSARLCGLEAAIVGEEASLHELSMLLRSQGFDT
uniref:Uncharacterized protein n=1 Tax=Oxyrrhis marina TaxID=2969 RepID=A0A7S3XHW0_OXYMA